MPIACFLLVIQSCSGQHVGSNAEFLFSTITFDAAYYQMPHGNLNLAQSVFSLYLQHFKEVNNLVIHDFPFPFLHYFEFFVSCYNVCNNNF